MKEILVALCAILAVTTARVVINIEGQDTPHLLGAKACTWGPSYWCQNITTAKGCNAMKHCIPKVWEKMEVPDDRDSVCQVCKDMVQQARDQLESNQTQEDLKTVFEGSCALIYIKPIVKECDRLVDQFIPELVETLASQMNPSVVCSVAGLCNSAHIDKLLEEYQNQAQIKKTEEPVSLSNDEYTPNDCSKCYTIAHHMEHKFGQASRDNVLEQFLNMCGDFSSFSDACSSIILTHFDTIYSHLQNNLNAQNVCHISGQCADKFHVHESDKTPEVEIRPLSSVGMVEIGDDLPCKLCEQLVGHLRDLLVANTTEAEFQQVLEGLCKQTKSFASECKAIVDEYYPEIYSYLTERLNSNAVCQMGGLCPAPGRMSGPIWPLLSDEHAKIAVKIFKEKDSKSEALESSNMQLPIDRMSLTLAGLPLVDDTYCSACEFFMNYIKNNVRDLKDEKEVKLVLSELKSTFPGFKADQGEENFMKKYEEAFAALILQGKDLSEICSLVAVCPSEPQIKAFERIPPEFTIVSSIKDKPNCPLCLYAVSKLYDIVKEDKTEESIERALDKLCHELPKSLNSECVDLVKIYSKELVQLLLSDMSPQEVCAYIKLCDPQRSTINKRKPLFGQEVVAVPKNNVEGKQACALCEYALHYIQQAITNPKAEDEVKQVIDKVCKKLPKSVENDCNQFIDLYGDALVAILAQEIDPSQICPMLHICPSAELLESWKHTSKIDNSETQVEDKPNCPLCLFGVTQLYNSIKNNKTEEAIEAALEKLCVHLPKSLINECDTLVRNYSKQIMEMILADLTPQEVCVYLQLCDPSDNNEPTISFFPLDKDGEIMTNEIPDYPMYIVNTEKVGEDLECEACQFIMQYVEKAMGTRRSKDEIEHIFHNMCNVLPKRMSSKCNNFVNEYGEIVIELLTQEVSPKEVCSIIGLCEAVSAQLRESVAECALCHEIITNIEKYLDDSKSDEHIDEVVKKVCKYLPGTEQDKCTKMMETYEQSIINIIRAGGDTRKICSKLALCSNNDVGVMLDRSGRTRRQVDDKNLGTKPCTWGISYWCVDDKTAEECKATELCKKKGRLPDTTSTTSPAISEKQEDASEAEQAISKDAQSSS